MKNLKIIAFLGFLFLAFSCSQNDTSQSIQPKVKIDLVSTELAISIANSTELQRDLFQSSQTSSSFSRKSVSDFFSVGDKVPSFYVINYTEGGFLILSADRKHLPILAYSSDNNFENKDVPIVLSDWILRTNEEISATRLGILKIADAERDWQNLVNQIDAVQNPAARVVPDPNDCGSWIRFTKGPLLSTTWGQNCGYNSYCPSFSDGPCGRAVTGCVATAMAQLMKYWNYPPGYNWNSMTLTSGNLDVARLMADAGGSVGMEYGATSSGAYHDRVTPSLRGTFGYSSGANTDYTYASVVQNEIDNSRPVILTGFNTRTDAFLGLGIFYNYSTGHEWVCDGYEIYGNNCEAYTYLHMNWGWSGSANGNYFISNWTIPHINFNFQYAREVVLNLHP